MEKSPAIKAPASSLGEMEVDSKHPAQPKSLPPPKFALTTSPKTGGEVGEEESGAMSMMEKTESRYGLDDGSIGRPPDGKIVGDAPEGKPIDVRDPSKTPGKDGSEFEPATGPLPSPPVYTKVDWKGSYALWMDDGEFEWNVDFSTTGRDGWIIQESLLECTGVHVGGVAIPDRLTRFYEAWHVDTAGVVSPMVPRNDSWRMRSFGALSKGHWARVSRLGFTKTPPSMMGMTIGAVKDALPWVHSASTIPSGCVIVKVPRSASGDWDSTSTPPVKHHGLKY